ncbi:MAG TPA: hypothetical protein VHC69_18210 [Polyangiaceae bacterium]|nr:hypothetical protein [Polyangiaceae bacterium]
MRLAIGLVLLCATSGCGRASASPALYTGRVEPRLRLATDVSIEPAVPETALYLGDVVARCRADSGVVAIDHESLADVDCSETLLVSALREKAASVGGAALVGLRCTATTESSDGALASVLRSCSAAVAGAATDANGAFRRGAPPEFVLQDYDPSEAFSVKVTLVPAEERPAPRQPIPSDAVTELAFVPPGRVVVGDIVAKGNGPCSRAAVRHAVRAAAGRVGATDVVGIACVRRERGFVCTGRATRPEIDEYGAAWAARFERAPI